MFRLFVAFAGLASFALAAPAMADAPNSTPAKPAAKVQVTKELVTADSKKPESKGPAHKGPEHKGPEHRGPEHRGPAGHGPTIGVRPLAAFKIALRPKRSSKKISTKTATARLTSPSSRRPSSSWPRLGLR